VFSPLGSVASRSSNNDRVVALGVGIGVGGVVLLAVAAVGGVYLSRKRRGAHRSSSDGPGTVALSSSASSAAYPVLLRFKVYRLRYSPQ